MSPKLSLLILQTTNENESINNSTNGASVGNKSINTSVNTTVVENASKNATVGGGPAPESGLTILPVASDDIVLVLNVIFFLLNILILLYILRKERSKTSKKDSITKKIKQRLNSKLPFTHVESPDETKEDAGNDEIEDDGTDSITEPSTTSDATTETDDEPRHDEAGQTEWDNVIRTYEDDDN